MSKEIVLRKFMSYAILISVFLVGISLSMYYYVNNTHDFPEEMCWKGRYLVRMGDEGSVYTRTKGLTCEEDKGIIILEYIND